MAYRIDIPHGIRQSVIRYLRDHGCTVSDSGRTAEPISEEGRWVILEVVQILEESRKSFRSHQVARARAMLEKLIEEKNEAG